MQNSLNKRYRSSLALLTDLYQITMAYGYWKAGRQEEEAIFHWFYRKNPFGANYAITAGLEDAIAYMQDFAFSVDDIQYLGGLKGADGRPLFEEAFLNYLQRMKFSCDIDALPEGRVVFAHEPLLRVRGPLIQAQLLETALLNILNFQTLIASKAHQVCLAAQGDTLLEFGLRRAQGIDGGLSASRAAYIAGVAASSNVLAGKLYGIPVKGTHAHSWVMSFEDEQQAFATYAQAMPSNCVFLVDTYDTQKGVDKAIEIGRELRAQGQDLLGIRLDSGDLRALSIWARKRLDEAGFEKTKIIASDSLNEDKIRALKAGGAAIDSWGVGTNLVTAQNQPALGGVYKLAALRKDANSEWAYKIKLSNTPIKISNPGALQVRRYYLTDGRPYGDMIWDELQSAPLGQLQSLDGRSIVCDSRKYEDLLQPIFRKGELCYKLPSLGEIRKAAELDLALFQGVDFKLYPKGLEAQLAQTKASLIEGLKNKKQ